MIFEIEGGDKISEPDEAKVKLAIRKLRSYGPQSFASLDNEDGEYVQVAGGGVTCMLERMDGVLNKQYRGYKSIKSKVFPDGTILAFGGVN